MTEKTAVEQSPKKRLIALLLCIFFGWTGIHRYYVDKIGTGVALMFTFGGFGLWIPIDSFLILFGMFKDSEGKPVKQWL
jgi:TM2 domain-containing membrane protein YozV